MRGTMQGTRLAGRYHLVERLAGGPMGELWAAQDAVLGRDVAVRILKPTLPADPDFAARFHAEARLLARLRHPGVVQIHDFGHSSTQDGTPVAYLVMDLIRGEALSALLDRRGPLEPAQALRLMSQVLTVLGTAHSAGVVHRDLKPSNLLLCEGTVVLTGFGIAPLGHDDTASGADDLYALGVVLHECLTGRLPVRSTLGAELPGPVRALVATALAEDPARRWPDAATMAAACELTLAAVLAQDPAEPAPARPVSSRGAARHRRVPRLLRGRGRLLLAVGLALRSLS